MKRPWALRTSQTRRLADDASKAGRHAHQDAMHPRRPRPHLALLTGLLLALAVPAAALAHPLGNFTINHYSGIRGSSPPERIVVDQVFDLAEIPALQALQPTGGDSARQQYVVMLWPRTGTVPASGPGGVPTSPSAPTSTGCGPDSSADAISPTPAVWNASATMGRRLSTCRLC